MRDKKFAIAVFIIVVLAFILLYFVVVGPRIEGYVINKQINAQQSAVNAIIQVVEQQGYVVLGDEENQIVLVKYQLPEEQVPPQAVQQEGFE